jgi:hypothetical protein
VQLETTLTLSRDDLQVSRDPRRQILPGVYFRPETAHRDHERRSLNQASMASTGNVENSGKDGEIFVRR